MNTRQIRKILKDTDRVRVSGTVAEKETAEYLLAACQALGAAAHLESFPVPMAEIQSASLRADGREIPCKGYKHCAPGPVEAPLCYLPSTEPAVLPQAKGKLVLLDSGLSHFLYQDLLAQGALGFITYDGSVLQPDSDIDQKELRELVAQGKRVPCVSIHAREAFKLVKAGPKLVRIAVEQTETEGESHNVVAELPGLTEEWIVLTAHYDSTPLSRGSYDNMSGCIGLLGILEAMAAKAPHRYGLRFVFCGSEERGLLGSKAYVAAHEAELEKVALNINLDMIGTVMGPFAACATAEEKLVGYLQYLAAERGWGLKAWSGVYSSDSTPFADKGVPAVSFARLASSAQASIHNRYDTMAVLSEAQIQGDIGFISDFTRRMADAAVCPVARKIPDKLKTELDEYLCRKRKG